MIRGLLIVPQTMTVKSLVSPAERIIGPKPPHVREIFESVIISWETQIKRGDR